MTLSDEDKAIANLLEWMDTPAWRSLHTEVLIEHLELIAEITGIPEEMVPDSLGSNWKFLLSFVLEHFFTYWFETEGEGNGNIIDDYLKSCGWKESVGGRRYLKAFRNSRPSLYEVLEVNPDRSVKLKDLLGYGKTILVYEKSRTRQLVTWDCLVARVLKLNKRHYLTEGTLYFSPEMSKEFLRNVDLAVRREKRRIRKDFENAHKESEKLPRLSRNFVLMMFTMPLIFSSFWADALYEMSMFQLPELRNTDDDSILVCKVRFPIQGDMLAVAAILDEIPDLIRSTETKEVEEFGGEMGWFWVALEDPSHGSSQKRRGAALSEETTEDIGGDIHIIRLGYLALNMETLILTTSSQQRGERGKALLEACLGDLVGPAMTVYSDILQAVEYMDEASFVGEDDLPILQDGVMQIIHAHLDSHYRRVLDEPLPFLGQMTPREAATKSRKSRREVSYWMKAIENIEQRRVLRNGGTPYGTLWMWQELGIRRPRFD